MSYSELLKTKRSSRYSSGGNTDGHTGDVNRSFPLTEEELMGLGQGPMSIRVHGEHKDGHFHVHRIEKDAAADESEDDDGDGVPTVRTSTQVSPS